MTIQPKKNNETMLNIEKLLTMKENQSLKSRQRRLSYKERKVNAQAPRAEEGRDKLRKATGRSKYPSIRRYPNEGTHTVKKDCISIYE